MSRRERGVVDACVLIALMMQEGNDQVCPRWRRSQALLERHGHDIDLFLSPLQFAEVLAPWQRKANIDSGQRKKCVSRLRAFIDEWALCPLELVDDDARVALDLWAKYGVKYQDGLMLAATLRVDAVLFTFDERLIQTAAGCREARVEIPPADERLPI